MKRKILGGILIFLLFGLGFGLTPKKGDSFLQLNSKPVDIYFNDILITDWGDALPFIDISSGRTMIPLRFYAEKIGCDVKWYGREKKIIISYRERDYYGNPISSDYDKIITLYVNNKKTTVYDKKTDTTKIIWLDQAPYQQPTYPWRVFVPLRFISSCLGDTVNWFPAGSQLPIFPDIKINKDTVMIAHFAPEGPNDYQIVPGERWGKYHFNMPIEQFIKYWGKPSIYCGSEDGLSDNPKITNWRKNIYGYYFKSSEMKNAYVCFVKNKGVVGLHFAPSELYSPQGEEAARYHLDKYYYLNWYNIEEFEKDFPPDEVQKFSIIRGGENVEARIYLYNNGLQVEWWEDYLKQRQPSNYRGWFLNAIFLWKAGFNSNIFSYGP